MSWLGQNGASRDDFYALADAYKKMYGQEQLDEKKDLPDFIQKKIDEKKGKKDDDKKEDKKPAFLKKEEFESWLDEVLEEGADLSEYTMDEVYDYWSNEVLSEETEEILDEYDVSYADGCMIEEGKKSCKKGYKWDSKKGKCVKKKKSSSSKSSKKTVVVVKGGGYRGPWMGGHGHHHDNDKDTDKGENGGGGETGGGDAGGGDGGGE